MPEGQDNNVSTGAALSGEASATTQVIDRAVDTPTAGGGTGSSNEPAATPVGGSDNSAPAVDDAATLTSASTTTENDGTVSAGEPDVIKSEDGAPVDSGGERIDSDEMVSSAGVVIDVSDADQTAAIQEELAQIDSTQVESPAAEVDDATKFLQEQGEAGVMASQARDIAGEQGPKLQQWDAGTGWKEKIKTGFGFFKKENKEIRKQVREMLPGAIVNNLLRTRTRSREHATGALTVDAAGARAALTKEAQRVIIEAAKVELAEQDVIRVERGETGRVAELVKKFRTTHDLDRKRQAAMQIAVTDTAYQLLRDPQRFFSEAGNEFRTKHGDLIGIAGRDLVGDFQTVVALAQSSVGDELLNGAGITVTDEAIIARLKTEIVSDLMLDHITSPGQQRTPDVILERLQQIDPSASLDQVNKLIELTGESTNVVDVLGGYLHGADMSDTYLNALLGEFATTGDDKAIQQAHRESVVRSLQKFRAAGEQTPLENDATYEAMLQQAMVRAGNALESSSQSVLMTTSADIVEYLKRTTKTKAVVAAVHVATLFTPLAALTAPLIPLMAGRFARNVARDRTEATMQERFAVEKINQLRGRETQFSQEQLGASVSVGALTHELSTVGSLLEQDKSSVTVKDAVMLAGRVAGYQAMEDGLGGAQERVFSDDGVPQNKAVMNLAVAGLRAELRQLPTQEFNDMATLYNVPQNSPDTLDLIIASIGAEIATAARNENTLAKSVQAQLIEDAQKKAGKAAFVLGALGGSVVATPFEVMGINSAIDTLNGSGGGATGANAAEAAQASTDQLRLKPVAFESAQQAPELTTSSENLENAAYAKTATRAEMSPSVNTETVQTAELVDQYATKEVKVKFESGPLENSFHTKVVMENGKPVAVRLEVDGNADNIQIATGGNGGNEGNTFVLQTLHNTDGSSYVDIPLGETGNVMLENGREMPEAVFDAIIDQNKLNEVVQSQNISENGVFNILTEGRGEGDDFFRLADNGKNGYIRVGDYDAATNTFTAKATIASHEQLPAAVDIEVPGEPDPQPEPVKDIQLSYDDAGNIELKAGGKQIELDLQGAKFYPVDTDPNTDNGYLELANGQKIPEAQVESYLTHVMQINWSADDLKLSLNNTTGGLTVSNATTANNLLTIYSIDEQGSLTYNPATGTLGEFDGETTYFPPGTQVGHLDLSASQIAPSEDASEWQMTNGPLQGQDFKLSLSQNVTLDAANNLVTDNGIISAAEWQSQAATLYEHLGFDQGTNPTFTSPASPDGPWTVSGKMNGVDTVFTIKFDEGGNYAANITSPSGGALQQVGGKLTYLPQGTQGEASIYQLTYDGPKAEIKPETTGINVVEIPSSQVILDQIRADGGFVINEAVSGQDIAVTFDQKDLVVGPPPMFGGRPLADVNTDITAFGKVDFPDDVTAKIGADGKWDFFDASGKEIYSDAVGNAGAGNPISGGIPAEGWQVVEKNGTWTLEPLADTPSNDGSIISNVVNTVEDAVKGGVTGFGAGTVGMAAEPWELGPAGVAVGGAGVVGAGAAGGLLGAMRAGRQGVVGGRRIALIAGEATLGVFSGITAVGLLELGLWIANRRNRPAPVPVIPMSDEPFEPDVPEPDEPDDLPQVPPVVPPQPEPLAPEPVQPVVPEPDEPEPFVPFEPQPVPPVAPEPVQPVVPVPDEPDDLPQPEPVAPEPVEPVAPEAFDPDAPESLEPFVPPQPEPPVVPQPVPPVVPPQPEPLVAPEPVTPVVPEAFDPDAPESLEPFVPPQPEPPVVPK